MSNLSARASPERNVSGRTDKPRPDPFLSNDFYPLTQAHNAVLTALRADESSPDADLSRRIASGSSMSGDFQGHTYRALQKSDTGDGVGVGVGSSTSSVHRNGSAGARPGPMESRGQDQSQAASISAGGSNQVSAYTYSSLNHTNSIPLPPYLTNIIKETKLSSLMGILPEGNMVWVSVDDALYLWEYGSLMGGRKKEDFVCFQVPSGQCVVSVGIVRPKPGEYHRRVSIVHYICLYL